MINRPECEEDFPMSRQERAPLRIIAHNGAPEWGGGEIALVDLLLGLAGRGHHVTLLCNRRLVAEAAQARGVETRLLRLGGDLAVHGAVRLALVLRRERPDAFIVGTFRKLWLAAAAARMAKAPNLVARLGLSTDTPRNFKYRFVLRRWVDHVVFVADVMRKSYVEAFPAARSSADHDFQRCSAAGSPLHAGRRRGGPSACRRTCPSWGASAASCPKSAWADYWKLKCSYTKTPTWPSQERDHSAVP